MFHPFERVDGRISIMDRPRSGAAHECAPRTRRVAVLAAAITTVIIGAHASAGTPAAASLPATRFTSSALSLFPVSMAPQSSPATDAPQAPSSTRGDPASIDGRSPNTAPNSADGMPPSAPATRRFGERGMVTFNIYGDYADNFSSDWMAGAQLGISWFFIDDMSLDLQLEQWGISQEGGNAYAIGPALLFRWHFLPRETWSLYTDFGCGFFYATEAVPSDGSRFNFTPRLGLGASFALNDRARILTGVRWLHISNANTSTPNPGRDSVELYAGLSLAF